MAARAKSVEFALIELTQSRIQQYRLRYVLAKLTQYIDQKAFDNPAHATLQQYMDGAVHIEHILPQTPTAAVKESFDKPDQYDEYVGKLGNLTLLEQTINTSMGNGCYADKRPCFEQSLFLLTKSLAKKPRVGIDTRLNRAVERLREFESWSSVAIEQRQDMLTELAKEVWLAELAA